MKKFFLAMSVCFVLTGLFTLKAMADGIREGKWSMTMVTKMDGLSPEAQAAMKQMQNLPPEARAMMEKMHVQMDMGPDGSMTTTVEQCITNKNPVPKSKKSDNCQETHDKNGNTVNFKVTCNRPDFQMDSTGQVTYKGDNVSGQIKSHEVAHGHDMRMMVDIDGKYLGPCDK